MTRTDLTAVRDSGAHPDRFRLRDILGDHGSSTWPVTTTARPSTRCAPVGSVLCES
ncbi:hypothetical protein [Streptomyces sp. NPDC003697]